LLFVFGVLLPLHALHPLPLLPVVGRAGPGELLFPLAFMALLGAPRSWLGTLRRSVSLLLPALLVLLGFLPSVLFAVSRRGAVTQLGVLVYVALLFFMGAHAARGGFGRWLSRGFVLGVCSNVVLGLAFAVLWGSSGESTGLHGGGHVPRLVGLAETPNMLSAQVTVALVVTLFTDAVPARLKSPAIALLGVGFVGAWGHTTFATIVAALALLALTSSEMRRQLFAAGAVASAGLLYAAMRVRVFPLSAESPYLNMGPSPYVLCHRAAAKAFSQHPFVGVGLESFGMVWPSVVDTALLMRTFSPDEAVARAAFDPHSTYLGYAAEGGVFGILVLVGLGLMALRAARTQRPPFLGLVLFAMVAGLTMDVLTNREIFLGLGLLFTKKSDNPLAT
jgi:hypothetical protein